MTTNPMTAGRKIFLGTIIFTILLFLGVALFYNNAFAPKQESITLPSPVGRDDISENNTPKEDAPVASLPGEINLNVPFTSQAPAGNWEMPFQEACEEASVLMVDKFYKKQVFRNAQDTEKEIEAMVEFEEKKLGFTPDMDAEQTAEFMKKYPGYANVKVVYDISIEDMKKEVVQGRPVIVPAAGRQLGNPNFRPPGPRYHMLVVKGYTKDNFITNDPGTRKGKDYLYDFNTLFDAVHDWNGGNVEEGRKVMIIVDGIIKH